MVREAHLFSSQVKCRADKESGPIVRIAPDQVVMQDPDALKTIYGPHSGFTKVINPKFERVAAAARAAAAATPVRATTFIDIPIRL